jgi:hypothetical protein
MEHDPTPPPAVPSHAPPTLPTGSIAQKPPSWPKVLGILCCVFAGLGLIGRLFQIVGVLVMPHLPVDEWMKPPAHLMGILTALTIAGLLISAVHVALAVQLLRRRPSVLALTVAFLLIVVALFVPNILVQVEVQQAQMQAMQQQMAQQAQSGGSTPPPMMSQQFGAGIALASGVMGGIIAVAWPLFLLIWVWVPQNRAVVRSWGER